MWLPTNIPYVIALSVLFFQWVGEHDRAERAAAGEFDFDDEEPAAASASAQDASMTATTMPTPTAPGVSE